MERKVLIFDIETAPNTSYTWGKWEQNVIEFVQESYMLCYAYQWLGGKTKVVALPDFNNYKKDKTDDSALTKSLWELFDEADIIMGHNGDAFDIKYANGRFLINKLPPPSNYQTIDTLKIARSRFKLNSNKLTDLGRQLGIGVKVETGGFALWKGCMEGDEKSWQLMKKYNKQDVDLLVAIYHELKTWAKNHPNMAIFNEDTACTRCQSENIVKKGVEVRGNSLSQRWKCQDCNGNMYTSYKGVMPLKSS